MGFADEFAPTSQIKKFPFSEGINATKAGLLTFSMVPNLKKEEATNTMICHVLRFSIKKMSQELKKDLKLDLFFWPFCFL